MRAKDEDTVRIRLDFIQFVVKLQMSTIHISIHLYSSQLPRDPQPMPVVRPRVAGACTMNHMTISRIDAADEQV